MWRAKKRKGRRRRAGQKGGILPLAALIPALIAGGEAIRLAAAGAGVSYSVNKALEYWTSRCNMEVSTTTTSITTAWNSFLLNCLDDIHQWSYFPRLLYYTDSDFFVHIVNKRRFNYTALSFRCASLPQSYKAWEKTAHQSKRARITRNKLGTNVTRYLWRHQNGMQKSGFLIGPFVPRDQNTRFWLVRRYTDNLYYWLHLAIIFECTFQRLIACASSHFFSQLFCVI